MKKFIYVFIMAIFVPMILTANNDLLGQHATLEKAPAFNKAQFISAEQPAELFHKGPALLKGLPPYYSEGLIVNPITGSGVLNNFAGTHANNCSQFWFDPISNYMVLVSSDYDANFETGAEPRYNFQITYSKDFGKTWNAKVFPTDSVSDILVRFPTGGMVNRKGTNDIDSIDIIINAFTYSWQTTSTTTGFLPKDVTFSWQIEGEWNDGGDPYSVRTPSNGTTWKYTNGSASVYENGTEAVITCAQRLGQIPNTIAQWGVYGQVSVSFQGYHITNDIPSSWDASLFYKDSSTPYTSTSNSNMFQATDNAGNVYVAVLNQFLADNPDRTRNFGVSMSSDMGTTWSDFNAVPPTLVTSFLTAQGAEVEWTQSMVDYYIAKTGNNDYAGNLGSKVPSSLSPYEQKAIVAISENNYSCFTSMIIYKKEGSEYTENMIVAEYHWNGSAWTINKVADLKGNYYLTFSLTMDGQPIYRQAHFDDGTTFTASKTADNENIIVSWIDINQRLPLSAPFAVFTYNDDQNVVSAGTVDTLNSSDIMIASRPVSGTEWTSFQVTNDKHFNKGLQLPSVVPSLKHVPLLGCVSLFGTDDPFRDLDPILNQMRTDRWMGYYVLDINFEETDKYLDLKLAVNENATAFTLNTPYPNPANDVAEVTFSVEAATYTTIKLYNALGNEVQTIQDGFVSAGNHGLTVNTSALSSGAYYIVLSNGSQSTTQMLNVIR